MASGHETSADPVKSVIEEMIYVAVGTNVKDCKSILLWALRNFGGKRICIVHVHRPTQWIPNGCKSEKIMCVCGYLGSYIHAQRSTYRTVSDHVYYFFGKLIMYIIFI